MPGPWEDYQKADSSSGPWQDYKTPAQKGPPREKYTPVESAAIGAVDAGLAGFADEAGGLVKTGIQAIEEPRKTYEKGLTGLMESYRANRNELRNDISNAQKDNPISSLGGNIVGSVATSFVPGFGWMNVAKGASTAAKIGTAAKAGALIGAGTSNADLTEGDVEKFAKDVAKGTATGVLVQGGLSAGGGALQGVVDRFKNLPETRAVKAVTGQNISALRQISDTTLKGAGDVGAANQRIIKVGRDILDEPGVLTPLSKVEDIAPRLAEARQKYGGLIGQVGSEIDKAVPQAVDAKNIANKIVSYAESIPETMQGQKLRDKLLEEAANFEKIGNLSFQDAQAFKNQFKYKAVDADALISNQDATNKLRGIIGSEMDQTAAKLAETGPQEVKDLLNNYSLYKSKYGSFKTASDAATDRVQKNITNRFVSPSDYGIGTGIGLAQAVTQGGPNLTTLATALAAAGANKFSRERGSALAATTADAILKTFKSSDVQSYVKAAEPLMNLARQGNPAAVLTFQLLNQKDPRAVQILNQQNAMQRRMGGQ